MFAPSLLNSRIYTSPMMLALACFGGELRAQEGGAGSDSAEASDAVSLELAYKGEVWANTRGGIRRDTVYLDNLDVILAFDGEALIGATGWTASVSGLYNNNATLSDTIVGDAQVVSNIDTTRNARLYEAWIAWDGEAAGVKVGMIDLNSEFDAVDTAGLFINSSHGIGADFSQVGENGPAIFPYTGLGARLELRPMDDIALRFGAFEGTPGDPARPRRTVFRLDGDEGALLVAEADFAPNDAIRVVFGGWHHTGRFDDLVATDINNDPVQRKDTKGLYLFGEGELARWGDAGERSLSAFVRTGITDDDTLQFDMYNSAGVVLQSPMLSGPDAEEVVGFAIASARNGDPFLLAGRTGGTSFERRETVLELTYRITPLPFLSLQPDVQYVINPGTDPALDNALVVGLRVELGWQL